MMKNLITVLLLFPLFCYSQERFKPGKIDPKLVEMKECPFDSSAGAFYLLEYGETRIDYNLDIELYHVVRLKITDKSELDRGDITIPYEPSKSVKKLMAFTYNMENGQLVTTKLEKGDIFKEKVDEYTTNLKFSMPNVREGSVIEYSYRVNYGNYKSLNTWYFQRSIPVLKSEYHIKIPDYFDYYRHMTGYIALAKADIKNTNGRFGNAQVNNKHHHYVALNVPAFDDERYVRSQSDVISKIKFELRSLNVPGVIDENYLFRSYGRLANKMMENDYWSKDISKAPWAAETLVALKKEDRLEEAQNIFEHIKAFEKADGVSISLKSCFKGKKGTDSELNRMLIAVLREAGFDADPVLVRTRNKGRLDPYNALRSNFNFTITRLNINDKTYLLDVTEKENVFGVLPRYCLNDKGLVVKEGEEEWVTLTPFKQNVKMTTSKMKLSEDGILTGSVTIKRKGYLAWDFKEDLDEEGENEYTDDFEKTMENWIIEDHTLDVADSYSVNEEIDVEVEGQVEDLGNLIYVNPMIVGATEENPFKGTERLYPVDFGIPFSEILTTEITIPEGMEVETLPEKSSVGLPNGAGMLVYSASQNGNKILINQRLKISKLQFLPDEYPILREFYARLIEKSGEQIVLKRI